MAKEITDSNISRVGLVTTDTCSTNEALWEILETDLKTKHIMSIPCDSHGLQLLIKYILLRERIKQHWDEASSLVAAFKKALK